MFPLISSLITGGAGLLGSLFSSQTSAANTQQNIAGQEMMLGQTEQFNETEAAKARDFSASQAEVQRQYQTQMSNTAFQRARADAVAAGINPIMLAGQGGASTPSGAMGSSSAASVGTPSFPRSEGSSPFSRLGDIANNMVSSALNAKTFDKMTDEVAVLRAQEARIAAETESEKARPGLIGAQTALEKQRRSTETERTREVGSEADIKGFGVTESQWRAEQAKRYLDMPSTLKDIVERSKYGAGGVSSIGDALSSFVPSAQVARRFYFDGVDRGRW